MSLSPLPRTLIVKWMSFKNYLFKINILLLCYSKPEGKRLLGYLSFHMMANKFPLLLKIQRYIEVFWMKYEWNEIWSNEICWKKKTRIIPWKVQSPRGRMGKSNPFSCIQKIQMFQPAILGVNLSSKQIYFKYYP